MNKILTIVIPTYNMEKYLDKCLASLVIEDRELMKQLEILVVIDGSKDRSSEIAHTYQVRYPQTFIVIDKENGNYGSCINRGLKEAAGKYIKVLDADDCYNSKSLQQHLELLRIVDVDLILTSYVIVNEKGQIKSKRTFPLYPYKEYFFDEICVNSGVVDAEMHAVTYKTENLKNIDYKQTEGISYTDQEWIFMPMTTVRTVIYQPVYLYEYLVGREGQTMQADILDRTFSHQVLCAVNRLKDLHNRQLSLKSSMTAFLYHNLGRVVVYIYRATIMRGLYDIDKLKELDATINRLDPQFYKYIGNASLNFGIKFKYILYFRNTGKGAPDIVQKIYRFLYKKIH